VSSAYDRLPLNALRVFEAVGTRLSFSEAAVALNVTPAAVSQQISALEDYLQVPLFKRKGRRVELTAEGVQLLPGVRLGLDGIAASLQHLKQHRRAGPLQISLLSSFLQHWLLPRVRSFRRACPEIQLRFHTSSDPVDFSRSPMHAAIRFGKGNYSGLHVEKLLDDCVVAVAAPDVIKQHGKLTRDTKLENLPLLDNTDDPWTVWSGASNEEAWRSRAPGMDDSAGLVAAAEESLGYALVRWTVVARSIEKGRLKLASNVILPYSWSYYFVCPEPYLALPKLVQFRDWLRKVASEFPQPPV
jgi:LysR family glycine cleavage system transcriptional activator